MFSFLSVCSCNAGEVPFNHEILREANALCHRLPVLSTIKFKTDFYDVSKLSCTFTNKMFFNIVALNKIITLHIKDKITVQWSLNYRLSLCISIVHTMCVSVDRVLSIIQRSAMFSQTVLWKTTYQSFYIYLYFSKEQKPQPGTSF